MPVLDLGLRLPTRFLVIMYSLPMYDKKNKREFVHERTAILMTLNIDQKTAPLKASLNNANMLEK